MTQQFPKSTQGYGGGRLVKHDSHPAKTDQNKKYRGSNGHPQKQSYGNGHGKEAAVA